MRDRSDQSVDDPDVEVVLPAAHRQSVVSAPPEINDPIVRMARILWRERLRILIVTAICGMLGAAGGALLTKKYEAKVVLLPLSNGMSDKLGGLGSLGSELGGLASLVGLSQMTGSFKQEAIATLKSNWITEQYIDKNNLLPILFWKLWDPASRTWRTTDREKIPTPWKGVQFFEHSVRTVEVDRTTGLVTLTVKWSDPQLAAKWADGVVAMTNRYLRDRAITTSERHIAYLKSEIGKTNQVDLQRAIYSLMESEIENEMLARGRKEYALRVIDPAMVPEKPVTPSVLKILAASIAIGLLLSIGWVMLRER